MKFPVWLMLFSIIYSGFAALPLCGLLYSLGYGHLECEAFFCSNSEPSSLNCVECVYCLFSRSPLGAKMCTKMSRCYSNTLFSAKNNTAFAFCLSVSLSLCAILQNDLLRLHRWLHSVLLPATVILMNYCICCQRLKFVSNMV